MAISGASPLLQRARLGFEPLVDQSRPAKPYTPGSGGSNARPRAGDVVAAAACMEGPAPARRPRGDVAYRSFRRLGGRGSQL